MKIAEAGDRDESHKLRENGIGEVQSADPHLIGGDWG